MAAVPRETYDVRAAPTGPLFVGSPQEIAPVLRRAAS
jgi:hypothetical protein